MSFTPIHTGNTNSNYPVGQFKNSSTQKRNREMSGIDAPPLINQVGLQIIDENGKVLKEARASDASPLLTSFQNQTTESNLLNRSGSAGFSTGLTLPAVGQGYHSRRHTSESSFSRASVQNVTVAKPKLLIIANTIKSLASAYSCPVAQSNGHVNQVVKQLDALIADLNEFKDFKEQLEGHCAKEIASMIYNCGKLAQSGVLSIPFESISYLVASLNEESNLTAEQISMAFNGLGMLAQGDCLDAGIDAPMCDLLLDKLTCLQGIDTLAIINTLYGLGILAETQSLNGQMTGSVINYLLAQLSSFPHTVNALAISTTCYGLGLLAESNCLNGALNATAINILLERLRYVRDLDVSKVCNLVYGLGLLAEAEGLEGPVDVKYIEFSLHQLKHVLDVSKISSLIYGLGILAEAECLEGTVDGTLISSYLERLSPRLLNAQQVSELLYGLGVLAQTGLLNGVIPAHLI